MKRNKRKTEKTSQRIAVHRPDRIVHTESSQL